MASLVVYLGRDSMHSVAACAMSTLWRHVLSRGSSMSLFTLIWTICAVLLVRHVWKRHLRGAVACSVSPASKSCLRLVAVDAVENGSLRSFSALQQCVNLKGLENHWLWHDNGTPASSTSGCDKGVIARKQQNRHKRAIAEAENT